MGVTAKRATSSAETKRGHSWSDVAFIGDDLQDLSALRQVG
jgi:3-deoxy-D-manno-octulosonate 8-phosphate phosphatase KdsC-like HAD superfamily phosphatase